jgi:glycosyltransferase involved in cell wall biosynthesis
MTRRATIVITSYNYARFLGATIDSALEQTYQETEVIVVDDGSIDGSDAVIHGYGDRVKAILKENGGQGSAFNAGFGASSGDAILFLDSDDLLAPTAVERAVAALASGAAKVHWPLRQIEEHGRSTGRTVPAQELPEGHLQDIVLRKGPAAYLSPPTTGNAWSRGFLEHVFPLPEADYRTCPDAYLTTLAPLFGRIARIDEPLGYCRVHATNEYNSRTPIEKNRTKLEIYDRRCAALSSHAQRLGLPFDPSTWKTGNDHYTWITTLDRAARELEKIVPEGETFILVDDDWWNDGAGNGEVLPGRHRLQFIERNGEYWGPPADDTHAVRELERLRHRGARFVVVAWSAFWWLEYYAGFNAWLRSRFPCVLENDRLVIFKLCKHRTGRASAKAVAA